MPSLFEQNPYYHGTIKRLISAFGATFSGITINTVTENYEKEKVVKVPIEYAPKHKWLQRIRADDDLINNVETTLPRLSFEITDIRYDASRKIGTQGNFLVGSIDGNRTKLFNPVPYDIYINLYSVTKSQTDALQITEQILPYFAPSMTINIEVLPTFSIRKDIPLLLSSVSVDDSYDGSPEEYRRVIQTFGFVAQLDLFGPTIMSNKVIKEAIANVGTNSMKNTDTTYDATVVPRQASKEDPHTIDETWTLKNF